MKLPAPAVVRRAARGCLLAVVVTLVIGGALLAWTVSRTVAPEVAARPAEASDPPAPPPPHTYPPAAAPDDVAEGEASSPTPFEEYVVYYLENAVQNCLRAEHTISCESGVCIAHYREPSTRVLLGVVFELVVTERLAIWAGADAERLPCRGLGGLTQTLRGHSMRAPSGVEDGHCLVFADPSGPPFDSAMKREAMERCRALELPPR